MVIPNGRRNPTLGEGRVRGSQPCSAALRGCRLRLIDHVLQRAAKIGLAKDLAGARRTAAGKEHLHISRKTPVLSFVGDEGVAKARIGRKPVMGQSDSCLSTVAETHRAVGLKGSKPAPRAARN